MSRPAGPSDRARRRTVIGSVIVGVLIVIAAAAGATAYVGRDHAAPQAAAPSAPAAPSTPATGAPGTPPEGAPAPAAPSVPGTDAQGFLGTPARCADGDTAVAMALTAQSQAVVCERAGALYYAGFRAATGSWTRFAETVPAGAGWVATASDATITVTETELMFRTASGDFTEPVTAFWKR